ncbi:hypothetical protein D9756_007909 [Leucocoprinus leucothites]|uniref:Uncharacterized protein n=1 Tax=Leucocoprinus leucothites TaxID=201217 RepID=A0A8H5D4X0_9AGAR|nr:hypothetical protein D9756_007909 [Leucoagaricus leucothites]
MALGKIRSRRDSFGLEVRPDGTLVLDLPGAEGSHGRPEVVKPLERVRSSEGAKANVGRPVLRQVDSDLRKSLGTLTKKRRRRDSFGLEVKEDGTLSLNQLVGIGASGTPGPSRPRTNEGIRANANAGRVLSTRASWNCGDSQHDNSRNNTSQHSGRRRRDSIGLEVRADGTLSLDQVFTTTSDGRGVVSHQESHSQSTSALTNHIAPPSPSYVPSNYRRSSRPTRTSGTTRNVASPHSSTHRVEGQRRNATESNSEDHRSEVELLREQVRRLEAELTLRGRPSRHSVDAPPAYESRRGSPVRE